MSINDTLKRIDPNRLLSDRTPAFQRGGVKPYTVAELREIARRIYENSSGTKAQLVERIINTYIYLDIEYDPTLEPLDLTVNLREEFYRQRAMDRMERDREMQEWRREEPVFDPFRSPSPARASSPARSLSPVRQSSPFSRSPYRKYLSPFTRTPSPARQSSSFSRSPLRRSPSPSRQSPVRQYLGRRSPIPRPSPKPYNQRMSPSSVRRDYSPSLSPIRRSSI